MNDLYKALGDISSIRRQMASTTEFRGYGPATLAATGIFAILAAGAQGHWVPRARAVYIPVYQTKCSVWRLSNFCHRRAQAYS
jgi:hypothetical protein